MTKLLLTPENQIQRLNHFLNYVEDVKRESYDVLSFRPNSTSWNVLEVLEHLRISHSLYKSNIDIALKELTQNSEVPWQYRPSLWTRLVLKGQRPKGNKRPFKIKTLKRFEPLLNENVTHDFLPNVVVLNHCAQEGCGVSTRDTKVFRILNVFYMFLVVNHQVQNAIVRKIYSSRKRNFEHLHPITIHLCKWDTVRPLLPTPAARDPSP